MLDWPQFNRRGRQSVIYEPSRSAIVIVPDSLREAINAKLDAAIAKCPDAAKDREVLYSHLVGFFDEYGYLPDFELTPAERPVRAKD